MPRKRMLSPDIWTDEGFIECSPMARLLFIGLISQADKNRQGPASALTWKARIFPNDRIGISKVDSLKEEVAANMRVLFYEREGREYYQLPQWGRYECRSYTNEWMKLRKAILKRDEYTCYYCHQKGGKLEVDHKIPLCRGGNNDPDNLVAACRACNRQKHDKTDREYLDYRISKNAEAAP